MKKIALCLTVFLVFGCIKKEEIVESYSLFVGTYTDGDSEGIYHFDFDALAGTVSGKKLLATLPNPSFLAISKDKNYLYAVQETSDYDAQGGGITAFALKDKTLKELNSKGTGGAHPCHVALSTEGQLAVSNYTGGNLAIFDISSKGSLGPRQLINHSELDTTAIAHVHKTHFNEDGLFASDLGLDAINRYHQNNGVWQAAHQASIRFPEGAGPRHFVFSENRHFLYVINELNATIGVLKRDDEGSYTNIQSISTIAPDYEGENSCADLHLSPDGLFLYGTNRGENTMVIFRVNQEEGSLSLLGREPVHGDWPRNFTIDPTGKFILIANQKSNSISIFSRDPNSGGLRFINTVAFPSPVCLVFE